MKTLKIIFLCIFFAGLAIAQVKPVHLTNAAKTEVVNNLAKDLADNYVYLDTAERMGKFIPQQLHKGVYDTIQNPAVFAERLQSDLLSAYHDGHLSIRFDALPVNAAVPDTVAEKIRRLNFRKKVNFGFDKAEILPGNV